MSREHFVDRHIGPNDEQVNFMLKELGEKSLEGFLEKVVPANIKIAKKLDEVLPQPISEVEAIKELQKLAKQNKLVKSLIGVGYYGTFLLGDPNGADAQGSASTLPGTPLVNGGSQTGNTLVIDGCPASKTGYLKAGDYIQLGSGSSSRLYKVLTDTNTNGSGQATLDIWPALRNSPSDNDPVVVSNTKGLFRLSSNIQQWEINDISSYGISFDCVEAL